MASHVDDDDSRHVAELSGGETDAVAEVDHRVEQVACRTLSLRRIERRRLGDGLQRRVRVVQDLADRHGASAYSSSLLSSRRLTSTTSLAAISVSAPST